MIVDAVCHVPYCAHPSYTQGYHDRDNQFYLEWDQISKTEESVGEYLREWVYEVPDRPAYWEKLGPEVHQRLTAGARLSEPVNYGDY
jgi:glutaconate CoA-transferase subunit A